MIFVDTSVWVGFFRGTNSQLTDELNRLLDLDMVALAAPVKVELLSGVSHLKFQKLKRTLSAIPTFFPDEQVWKKVEDSVELAVAKGERFGFADLLIASIAYRFEGSIWSLDRDFLRMSRLQFVKLHKSS